MENVKVVVKSMNCDHCRVQTIFYSIKKHYKGIGVDLFDDVFSVIKQQRFNSK